MGSPVGLIRVGRTESELVEKKNGPQFTCVVLPFRPKTIPHGPYVGVLGTIGWVLVLGPCGTLQLYETN